MNSATDPVASALYRVRYTGMALLRRLFKQNPLRQRFFVDRSVAYHYGSRLSFREGYDTGRQCELPSRDDYASGATGLATWRGCFLADLPAFL